MKDLIWDNSLSVQIEEIDEDHRRLIELFNLLSHSIAAGEAANYIEAVIEELLSFTLWHFRHEERLMLKYGYDDLAEHRTEHQELIDSAQQLLQPLLQKTQAVSIKDIEFLEHWLTGHILSSDMELGSYLCKVI